MTPRASLLLASIAFAFQISAQTATAKLGAMYGSREPHLCVPTKSPGNGPPSLAIAQDALFCSKEGERTGGASHVLYLLENLKFELSPKGERSDAHGNLPSVDAAVPVYALHGSYVTYICDPVNAARGNAGANCALYTVPTATGVCFKTTAGVWQCGLNGAFDAPRQKVAPPKK